MYVGLVTASYGDPWDEAQLVASRLAGALACGSDVDVLVPGGPVRAEQLNGALVVRRFPGTQRDPARQRAWRKVALGPALPHDSFVCSCRGSRQVKGLPALVESQLLLAEGGDSPDLYRHLRETPYDLVVFVGVHSPATYWGARAVPDGRRVAVVPATIDEDLAWLGIHAETLERAERVVVSTEGERAMWADRMGGDSKIENINFLVGVNPLARQTDPHDFDGERYLIVAQDWTAPGPATAALSRLPHWARLIEREIRPRVRLRVVGPGAEQHPLGIRLTASRLDTWRWMSRAMAVLDPVPQRLVARQVLEAFLYRVPVLVHARGGAGREHAEVGNGGLWFRTDDELCAAVQALLDDDLVELLGEQGRSYADQYYADGDTFIKRVAETFQP